MTYKVCRGGYRTIEKYARSGAKGYNPKTLRWELLDEGATYRIERKGWIATLYSDTDLRRIAGERGLIF